MLSPSLDVPAVAGCARPQERFYRAGASDADWIRDQYECARDASVVVQDRYAYVTESRIAVDPKMLRFCLEARGWSRTVTPTEESRWPFVAPATPAKNINDGRRDCGPGYYWDSSVRDCQKVGVFTSPPR